jgi:nitronate monooxygenase
MGIRISGANLASAVAEAGGIGVISAVGLGWQSAYFDPQEKSPKRRTEALIEANRLALIDELTTARHQSPNGILGINVMMAARGWGTLVEAAAQTGANLIMAGAGLPLALPSYTADYPQVALVPIVSSLRAAQIICRRWLRQFNRLPDGFVVESPQFAGGHLGASLAEIDQPAFDIQQVIPALVRYITEELKHPIPVIAAGGVWDRTDIDQMLALGASGVQMGTRFITTHECDAHLHYKEYHLQARPEDVTLVSSPVGLPGRALRNPFVTQVMKGEIQGEPCVANCLQVCRCRDVQETYCIMQALNRAATGDVENGLIFSGIHAGRAKALVSVAELMGELVRG